MKKVFVIGILMAATGVAGGCSGVTKSERRATAPTAHQSTGQTATSAAPSRAGDASQHPAAAGATDPHGHDHGHDHSTTRVPAFEVDPVSLKKLSPTLSPDRFQGKQKLAYQAVKEIPKTIAQLPCYCHCDQTFGHKSLHSCFVDDHAAHCAVCVDEALLAYQLHKEQKLSPEQIRDRIIAEYSAQQ